MKNKILNIVVASVITIPALTRAKEGGGTDLGNPDGFQIAGEFVKTSDLMLPEVSLEELRKMRQQLLSQLPPENLRYNDLFESGDQEALNAAQGVIDRMLESVAQNIFSMKVILSRAVVGISHFYISDKKKVGAVTEMYRVPLKDHMRNAILQMAYVATSAQDTSLDYYGNQNANNISNLYSAASLCKSEACVMEIEKVAEEIFDEAVSWDGTVKFNNVNADHVQVFWSPKHEILRRAMRSYVSRSTQNKDVSALRFSLTAATSMFYMGLTLPIGIVGDIATIRKISSSLNFDTKIFTFDGVKSTCGHCTSMEMISSNSKEAAMTVISIPFIPIYVLIQLSINAANNTPEDLREKLQNNFIALGQSKLRALAN